MCLILPRVPITQKNTYRNRTKTNKVEATLNRNLLATLIPSFATQTNIDLSKQSISFVDTRTFMQLSHIAKLSLSNNYLIKIDSFIFNDLINLIDLNLNGN